MIKKKKKNVRINKLHTQDKGGKEKKKFTSSSLNLRKLGFKLIFQLPK